MKIYFAASIRGGRQDRELYARLITLLGEYGTVLTEHIGLETMTGAQTATDIYRQDMDWLEASDAVVAEVTQPSLGVGYEIAKTETMGKPILCLYRAQPDAKISAMLIGNRALRIHEYADTENLTDVRALCDAFFGKKTHPNIA